LIVVDTSVWVDFFNGKSTPQTLKLQELLGEEPVLVGDLILCELLQGARSDAHAKILEKELGKFAIVGMLDADIAVAAARHYRAVREQGITIRKTIDLIIGTFCIVRRHRLLHADRDFEPMQKYLGLEVVAAAWGVNEPR
jgi:predicted nucleic acid-binding protein